jgi:hypothetical protein
MTETWHDAIVTVQSFSAIGDNEHPVGHKPKTETFPARIRSRYTYKGRPAFMAGDPQQAGATSVRPPDQKASA